MTRERLDPSAFRSPVPTTIAVRVMPACSRGCYGRRSLVVQSKAVFGTSGVCRDRCNGRSRQLLADHSARIEVGGATSIVEFVDVDAAPFIAGERAVAPCVGNAGEAQFVADL